MRRQRQGTDLSPAETIGDPTIGRHLGVPCIMVVIPCFRAAATVGGVIAGIGPGVTRIYVVDDGCPEGSGEQAAGQEDSRVKASTTRPI
jgi:hypothetical protein